MKSFKKYAYLFLCFSFFSCGFKANPVAPQAKKPAALPLEYCSPYDPKCSLRYADYIPGLDPKNPQHQEKIRKIEATHKFLFEREQEKKSKKDEALSE